MLVNRRQNVLATSFHNKHWHVTVLRERGYDSPECQKGKQSRQKTSFLPNEREKMGGGVRETVSILVMQVVFAAENDAKLASLRPI